MLHRLVLAVAACALFLLLTVEAAAAPPRSPTVAIAHSSRYGTILVAPSGKTLYEFKMDKPNKSVCIGACANLWPAFLLPKGQSSPVKPSGLRGTLSSIPHGSRRQVTYDGHPLYSYIRDKKAGQTLGEGAGHVWFVVKVR